MEKNTPVKVRLYTYKSFRHYGGCETTTTPHIVDATFQCVQRDHTILVSLVDKFNYFKAGHLIAVLPKDFNI